jgi:hypothetical protein
MEALRIFANAPVRPSIPRPTPAPVLVIVRPPVVDPPATDRQIIDTLAGAPAYGETIEAAYRRKERELAALFAALDRADAVALYRRLSEPRDDDRVAAAFMRLVVDRRTRLLATLRRR